MRPTNVLYYGVEADLPEQVPLRAGPLSLIYEAGDLRYIRLGRREILRRMYVAVRDHNWGTVLPAVTNVSIDARDDSFDIRYDVVNRAGAIDFAWSGTISGDSRGTIRFSMEGTARSTFLRNRIGFCVLHPVPDSVGAACTVEHVDGSSETSQLPVLIAPHQPFTDIRAITHEVMPGVRAEVRFEGDVFEMEDQRNWIDASYKTYSTPLRLPFPVEVAAGMPISQVVTLILRSDPDVELAGLAQDHTDLALTLGPERVALPRIGLGMASHDRPISPRQVAQLRALDPAHLRVDLTPARGSMEAELRRAAELARALGAALEVAVHLSDAAEAELQALRRSFDELCPLVSNWLIFHTSELSTSARWVELARQHLAAYNPEAKIGAGTDANFTEINRERPPVHMLDLVCYSINPQVHAFDNLSLVETFEGIRATVASARAFAGELPIAVGPVTLKQRFNPYATGEPIESGPLPSQVDPRQMSLFGAAWTVAAFKALAESRVYSTTWYETTGWRGVMETEAGSPAPDAFRSLPGEVFPLYHVLADVAEFAGGEVIVSRSTSPLVCDGLALHKDARTRVLLANFTPRSQAITVRGLRGAVALKLLDATHAERAMRDPEQFREDTGMRLTADPAGLALSLPPFALVRIDASG